MAMPGSTMALHSADMRPTMDSVRDDEDIWISSVTMRLAAMVFKMTDQVTALATASLEKHGIEILTEGSIKGDIIDKNKLIDQYYYSIASKAKMLKPVELNRPEGKFPRPARLAMERCRARRQGLQHQRWLQKAWAQC